MLCCLQIRDRATMVISAEKHEEVFLHAMGLMKDSADGSGEIYKTLKHNDISDIIGIFVLKWTEIEDLKYKVSNKGFSLSRGQKSMLCILSAYNTKNIRAGTPLKVTDWLTVTQDIFDDFRMIYKPDDYFASEPTHFSTEIESNTESGGANHKINNEHGETVDGSLFHDSLTEQPSEGATHGDNAILSHVTQCTDLPPDNDIFNVTMLEHMYGAPKNGGVTNDEHSRIQCLCALSRSLTERNEVFSGCMQHGLHYNAYLSHNHGPSKPCYDLFDGEVDETKIFNVLQNLVHFFNQSKQTFVMKSRIVNCFKLFVDSWGDGEQQSIFLGNNGERCDADKHKQRTLIYHMETNTNKLHEKEILQLILLLIYRQPLLQTAVYDQ